MRTERNVMIAASKSRPECSASERTPKLPVRTTKNVLRETNSRAEPTLNSAARFFSRPSSTWLIATIARLDYLRFRFVRWHTRECTTDAHTSVSGSASVPKAFLCKLAFSGDKEQRSRIHAVAKPGRLRAIREDVSQMRVAKRAFDCRSQHARAEIFFLAHIFRGDWLPKARPARAGVEFRSLVERRVAAIDATVEPRRVLIVERTGKSEFGRRTPRYVVLQRRELLLPFGFVLPHFRQRINPQLGTIVREFHDLDRALIVFRLAVIGESRKANTFHAHQQAVRSGRRRAEDKSASRQFIYSGTSCKKNT